MLHWALGFDGFFGTTKQKCALNFSKKNWLDQLALADDNEMDVEEIMCEDVDWIHLAHWRTLVNKVMNLRVLYETWSFDVNMSVRKGH
jgi:hypothetical protein